MVLAQKSPHRSPSTDWLIDNAGLTVLGEAWWAVLLIEATGEPLPEGTLEAARQADAILLGAGGPQWDALPMAQHSLKKGLLGPPELDLFANLRPAILYPELADASSLKPEVVSGLDILIVRELTGGIYFGQPRGVEERDGVRTGFNPCAQ